MTRVTFKVLYFIKRTRELKDGTVPIYVRVTVNGQSAQPNENTFHKKIIEIDGEEVFNANAVIQNYQGYMRQLFSYLKLFHTLNF